MKVSIATGKNGKRYLRLDGNALAIMTLNSKGEPMDEVEDALVEALYNALTAKQPIMVLESVNVTDYNRHQRICFGSELITDDQMVKAHELMSHRDLLRVEVYDA